MNEAIIYSLIFLVSANMLSLYVYGGPHVHKMKTTISNTIKFLFIAAPIIYIINIFFYFGAVNFFEGGGNMLALSISSSFINFICMMIIAFLFHQEPPTIKKVIGILIIIGGSYAASIN